MSYEEEENFLDLIVLGLEVLGAVWIAKLDKEIFFLEG